MDSRRSAASLWKALHVGCENPGYSCMREEMSVNKERRVWVFTSNLIPRAHDQTFPRSCMFCTELRATQLSPELKPLQQKGRCLFAPVVHLHFALRGIDLTHCGTCYGQNDMLVQALHSIELGVPFYRCPTSSPPGSTKESAHPPFLLNSKGDIMIIMHFFLMVFTLGACRVSPAALRNVWCRRRCLVGWRQRIRPWDLEVLHFRMIRMLISECRCRIYRRYL